MDEKIEKIGKLQSKAVKWFAGFLVFMLCCTLISRGVYAHQMPQVEVGRMERKSLVHEVEASGSVIAAGESAVVVPEGIRVEEICVRPGEKVQVGTILFRMSPEDLTEKIEALEKQIALDEQRLKELQASQNLARQKRQIDASRAKEDLENVTRTQELSLQQTRQRYDEARSKLSSYPNCADYCDERMQQDAQYQALKSDPNQAEAFHAYASALQRSLQLTWAEGREDLQKMVDESTIALQMADNEKNLAILQANRNVEDANRETVTEKSSVMEMEQNLQSMQNKMGIYKGLLEQGGEVHSDVEGAVWEVQISAGGRTTDTMAMTLADSTQGCLFEALLTKEQIQYLDTEGGVMLKLDNGDVLRDCSILAKEAINGEHYRVTAEPKGKKLSLGELGMLTTSSQSKMYECCVPLDAIHNAGGKDYIFVIRETNTILGTELSVVKRAVHVIDKNGSYAALEAGSLGEEEEFVISSDREIAQGDTVRLADQIQ